MAKRQSSQFNTRQYMLREDFEVFKQWMVGIQVLEER